MLINYALFNSLTVLYVEDEHFLQEEIKENRSPFVKRILTASDGELLGRDTIKVTVMNRPTVSAGPDQKVALLPPDFQGPAFEFARNTGFINKVKIFRQDFLCCIQNSVCKFLRKSV